MKLLRKLQPVSSTQFAVVSSDDSGSGNLQLVPFNGGSHKAKWTQHLHVPKLFKSSSNLSSSDVATLMSGSLRSRKRDALRRSFFRKSPDRELDCDNDNDSDPAVNCKMEEPEDRSSTETTSSCEEFSVDDIEQSASETDSDCEDSIRDEFVFPPVVIPIGYRQQDRMGGVTVAGRRVLFTFAAFKRNSLKVSQLRPIAEEAQSDPERSEPHQWPSSSALRRGYSRRGLLTSTDHNEWI